MLALQIPSKKGKKKRQALNADSEGTSSSIISLLRKRESKAEHVGLFLPWLLFSLYYQVAFDLFLLFLDFVHLDFSLCLCGSFVPFVLFMLLAPIVRVFSISLGA